MNLTALQLLELASNRLTGEVGLITAFTQLRWLDLASNDFTGPAPMGVLALHTLWHFDISHNSLRGTLDFEMPENMTEGVQMRCGGWACNLTHLQLQHCTCAWDCIPPYCSAFAALHQTLRCLPADHELTVLDVSFNQLVSQ